VDNSPASPNFGAVYLAYNWRPSYTGTAIVVIATRDGTHWVHVDVPPIGMDGYPSTWTFGNRVAVAPDGSAYVSFYEADLRYWNSDNMFNEGGAPNIGRTGFVTAHLHFGESLSADKAVWSVGLVPTPGAAFDPESQSGLAISDSGRIWLAVNDTVGTGGTVRIGNSTDEGLTWTWRSLDVPGSQGFKASIAAAGDRVFVGWHAMSKDGLVRTYYTLSYDGGATFLDPRPATTSTYREPRIVNGTGLRENATFENGLVFYAWGDNRSGVAAYVVTIQP
jgi:hypothetical protein